MITVNTLCTKKQFESLPSESNIMVEVKMIVNGEIFHRAFTVENYRDLELKELMIKITHDTDMLGRGMAAVYAGRPDLYESKDA